VHGALSLIEDTAVNEELLVLECLDTVLDLDVLDIAVDGGSNLNPRNKKLINVNSNRKSFSDIERLRKDAEVGVPTAKKSWFHKKRS
jgi:hypothetical protein